MTEVITVLKDWFKIRKGLKGSLGFVPTMGALHKGHKSLFEKSVEENEFTVASVFVNPTQFNNPNDLQKYPKTFEQDLEMLNEINVDFLIFPEYETLYPDNYVYKVTETDYSTILEGEHRHGHFDGVLTVVMKLLNIVNADKAYFGEKDFQQYKLIEGMTKAFFMKTEIISCPTIREEDGLAFSSRNVRLTEAKRKQAPLFFKLLKSNKTPEQIINELTENGFKVDYITDVNKRRYGAVYLGNVRLIDNVEL
ncbi:MAG: pantoate--beta-alanine ligase [Bacteroidetes bacterium]|nr:pantoate--beta-alanine ligase [Bacteroidota bacterium]